MAGGGARLLRLRFAPLTHANEHRVMVREISLFQRNDARYTVAINEFDEAHPRHVAVKDINLECSRPEAIAAFEEQVAESRLAGWTEPE